MQIKDNFKLALLVLLREKRKNIYSGIILLFVILSLSLFVYRFNTNRMMEYSVENNIGFKTLIFLPRSSNVNTDEVTKEELNEMIESDIIDIKNLDHVVDVYRSGYYDFVAISDFKNDFLDGTLTLIRGNENTLPDIVAGRSFNSDESGVAICPVHFYPNFEPRQIEKEYVINGYDLINKSFNITYGISDENTEGYTKTFKIVGLYDSSKRFNDNGTCYISEKDIVEIVNNENNATSKNNSMLNSGIPVLYAVVDDKENINDVKAQMEEMNFSNIEIASVIDTDMVDTIYMSFIFVFVIILITVIIIIPAYTKWRLKSEEKNIGILRVCGYTEKDVCRVYLLKILMQYIILYCVGLLIFICAFVFLKENVQAFINIDYMLGGLKINFGSILFSILTNVCLPVLVMIPYLRKLSKIAIVSLIGEND